MESNLSFFSLPFVDSTDVDFSKIKGQDCNYEDLHPTLPSHGSLLGPDDVLAQFLSGDELLEEPDLNGPTTLHCEICKKQFDNAKKYYGHLRVHSKENLWVCDKCPNTKFSTKQQLMKHGLTHKPLERVWQCPQCELAFEALWRLQQHLFAKHLNYRPHKCDKCTMAFHKLSDLKKHQDIHNGIRRHECGECGARLSDRSNLRRHALTHRRARPHACPGCSHTYTQVSSMRRHSRVCSRLQRAKKRPTPAPHAARQQPTVPTTEPKEPKPVVPTDNQPTTTDNNKTVDNIVDDILSAEDDYLRNQNNQMIDYHEPDNLMQIELLKDMNHMHILDDELLYNDIDFDLQNICNTDIDYTDRNELLFDMNDGRSIDQDIMNALYQVKGDNLTDELLNQPEITNSNNKVNDFLNPVAVNECATIFESDVDLEASTNLAANLNQLIGENSVQYISTEHDDTFIISLNSEIDAEQLTDMLNIGLSTDENKTTEKETVVEDIETNTQPFVVRIENLPENSSNVIKEPILVKIEPKIQPEKVSETVTEEKPKAEKIVKPKIRYFCSVCNKIFDRKDNYKSHRGTHNPSLRSHKCEVCGESFGYRSTLNKHTRARHSPAVRAAHACTHCTKVYAAAWMLKRHIGREHEAARRFTCDHADCGKTFYDHTDLDTHKRFHSDSRIFSCGECGRAFHTRSHLTRHAKRHDTAKEKLKTVPSKNIEHSPSIKQVLILPITISTKT